MSTHSLSDEIADPSGKAAPWDTELQTAGKLFAEADTPPPFVLWNPNPHTFERGVVQQFANICDRLSQGAEAIPHDALDLGDFGGIRDWLMVLTTTEDSSVFRYEHYGSGIARSYGKDMTGCTTDAFPGHISAFFTATYQAVRHRKERLMTVHQPPRSVFVSTWRRMIVPVVDGDGQVVQFLVLNVPENELRAGLEILPVPVLIVDKDHCVCYANKQARQEFDAGGFGPWGRTVFDYAALDLAIKETPAQILENGIVQTSQCRHIKHTQIGGYQATISAALHHDVAFYVVLLQRQSH